MRRSVRRRAVCGAALAGLGLAFGRPPGLIPAPAAAQAPDAAAADELRLVSIGAFAGLDPTQGLTGSALRAAGAAEGLLRVTPFGDVEGELAQSCELVDPATWRIALRPGVRFWSGRPLDAAAVAESLERAQRLNPAAATLLRGVAVRAQDELTLLLQADAPAPGLPYNLANEALVVHNAQAYGDRPNPADLGAADLTGFFRVVAWEPQTWAVLDRNQAHWGTPPRTRRVRLEGVADPEARTLVAMGGEAHLVRLLPPSAAAQVERSRTMRLASAPSPGPTSAFLNVRRPPLDDVLVRRALAWATDRAELVTQTLEGRGQPAPSLLTANPLFPEASQMGYTRHDPAEAARLLDQAGWRLAPGSTLRRKDGRALTVGLLWWGSLRPVAEVLQAQWARVGVGVEVQGSGDYAFVQAKMAQEDFAALLNPWGTFGDPQAVLARFVGAGGDLNHGRFADEETEALLAAFADLLDPEARRQQALKINQRIADAVPLIPLTVGEWLNAVHRNVRNYQVHFLSNQREIAPDLWVAA